MINYYSLQHNCSMINLEFNYCLQIDHILYTPQINAFHKKENNLSLHKRRRLKYPLGYELLYTASVLNRLLSVRNRGSLKRVKHLTT